jgi:SAM-dependent methyltransferase
MGIQDRVSAWLDGGRYAAFPDRWDDNLFHEFVLERLTPSTVLLDLGAGAGIVPEMNFLDRAARVCGVDPDPRVVDNPYLHEGRVGVGEQIPYDDETFDLVICDNVLEHLENPEEVFAEVRRVLKPGGRFIGKTPNFWHYVAIGASLTPHSFHQRFNAARGREEEDTFPTMYRANTKKDLQRLAKKADLELRSCTLIEGRPEYLRRWWPAYLLGAAYEWLVNSTSLLEGFRVILIGELRRPEKTAQ